jgi:parallel beta-helix repeat protein
MVKRVGTIAADVLVGTAEADSMLGGDGNDLLVGDLGDDTLYGENGDDVIAAGAGSDLLDGGDGADLIFGESGNDTIAGGAGADILNAGEGDDRASGGAGDDVAVGGDGNDVIAGGDGNDAIAGETGNDVLDGDAGDDVMSGGIGDDTLSGGSGADLLIGDAGNDSIGGGIGADTLVGGDGLDALAGDGGDDVIVGNQGDDTLDGGDGADTLGGDDGNDQLSGGAGNDLLFAGQGDDLLDGGAGIDIVNGGGGNDTIISDDGADILVGGDGNDSFRLDLTGDVVGTVVLGDSGFDTLSLVLSAAQLNDAAVSQALNALALQAADPAHDSLVAQYAPLGITVGGVEKLVVNGSQWSPPAPPTGNTIYIDPNAPDGGNGSLDRPFNDWGQVEWTAGWRYLQKAGTTYEGSVLVTGQGTEAAPIEIGSYGAGAAPQVHGSIAFYGAAYVEMQGFDVYGSAFGAVLISNGGHHIDVHDNALHDSLIGVVIATDAGDNNRIADNEIHDNTYFGVAVHGFAARGAENVVTGNHVYQNGSHGMELNGAGAVISDNTVEDNGISVGGSSGIHVIATADPASGSRFEIVGNAVIGTRDAAFADGNGIQLDTGSHANLVHNNFTFGNDGAGILLYGARDNVVTDNVLFGNVQDLGGTHWLDAELAVTAPPGASAASVAGNTLSGNDVFVQQSDVVAILVDATATLGGQFIGGNNFDAPANVYSWAGTEGLQASTWNALAAGGGDDAFSAAPVTQSAPNLDFDYSFGASGPTGSIDGVSVQLAGWSDTHGLIIL